MPRLWWIEGGVGRKRSRRRWRSHSCGHELLCAQFYLLPAYPGETPAREAAQLSVLFYLIPHQKQFLYRKVKWAFADWVQQPSVHLFMLGPGSLCFSSEFIECWVWALYLIHERDVRKAPGASDFGAITPVCLIKMANQLYYKSNFRLIRWP